MCDVITNFHIELLSVRKGSTCHRGMDLLCEHIVAIHVCVCECVFAQIAQCILVRRPYWRELRPSSLPCSDLIQSYCIYLIFNP